MGTPMRRRQSSDSLIIEYNSITASGAREVGLNDIMNNFGPGILMRRRKIIIANNEIKADNSLSVGIRNLSTKYCNLSAVVIFVVVVAILFGLGIKWATQGEMSRLTILINYDGRWVNSTYENCKTKGVLVSDKITLEELRKNVYNIVNVDPIEYEITMKVIYEAVKTAWPAEIADDDDVRAFIFESLSSSDKIPLCITLKGKISNQQAPSVDEPNSDKPNSLEYSRTKHKNWGVIMSYKTWSVEIGNLFNNHRNLSAVVIFLLLVVALTSPTTLLTQGEMSRLTILINYDGRWVNSTYKNCKTKGVLVSNKITKEELRKKVYNIVNVDPIEYEITMKVIYKAMEKTARPVEIADDDDVRAFIFESLSRSYKIPLCITLKGKIINIQAPSVDVGQESM